MSVDCDSRVRLVLSHTLTEKECRSLVEWLRATGRRALYNGWDITASIVDTHLMHYDHPIVWVDKCDAMYVKLRWGGK